MKHQTLWQQLRGIFAGPAREKRNYKAARVDRLNSGWITEPTAVNRILRNDLRILRARARDMSRNNSHFRKFLNMARTNIVGKGIQLQGRARNADGSLNGELNKRIEEAFWDWAHPETCTISQKLDWPGVQRLFVTHLIRDGEALVRHVRDKRNPFGYSLRVIDPSYLDETFNEALAKGNRIVMSVEIDDNDRPVAYHLTTPASEILFGRRAERTRTRVPASEIEHAFLVYDDEAQVRGVTWFSAAMPDAKNLAGYNEGVITQSRVAAMSMGFLERAPEDETEYEGMEDEDGNEQAVEIDIAPVTFNELPPGYTLKQFDPKQPTQNHAAFVDTILRDVATGLGINFFSLTGDMSAVNYSSARVGLGEERDVWRELQAFVAMRLCRPVYHRWLRSAMLTGSLKLNESEFKEAQNPMWRGRGWRYVDPQKEVRANVEALQNNLTTLTDVLAEQGVDIQEHFETLKRERELAAQYGIDLRQG